MPRFNEIQFNVPQFNQPEVQNAGATEQSLNSARPKRPYLLQALLNYFDDADVRVRESRNSLDAQLLGPLASALESVQMRLGREQASTDPRNCPLNIDNFGIYHKLQVPDTYEFAAAADGSILPPNIRVFTDEKRWKIIQQYDDFLPVPSGLEIAGDPVPCRSLFIYELDGDGGLRQESNLGTLAFPNRLYLRIENLGEGDTEVKIQIEGRIYPTTISLTDQPRSAETLTLVEENLAVTRHAWDTIDQITVWGLPTGATLRVAIAPAAFGMELETSRPVAHPAYRGLDFQRYWKLRGTHLDESVFLNRFARFETLQSYLCAPAWSAFAIEPNTYGIFGVSGSNLIYVDRREPWPDNLNRSALHVEPFYNLNVVYQDTNSVTERRVELQPIQNSRSADCYRFRYTVEFPNGAAFAVGLNGELTRLTSGAGWRSGTPKPISVALPESGSYRFTMGSSSMNGDVTEDIVVYHNPTLNSLWSADLSSLVPEIYALVFDRYQRLWIWTGESMIPLRFSYDSFVFDQDTRSVYLTNRYDQVELT
jgi:hypothetical protein